jgi:putative transcriptional regulator
MPGNEIKAGKVLIAQKFWDNELYHRSVILILEHDENGTTGLILNKAKYMADIIPLFVPYKEEFLKEKLGEHKSGFMTNVRNFAKTIKISDEILYKERTFHLQKIISEENKNVSSVQLFMGLAVWGEGQLALELDAKNWWLDDFKVSELLEVDNKNLWEYKLLKSGCLYGLFGDVPDPSLN